MTESTVIPEPPGQFSDEEFQTATSRVHAARERLLRADAARAAHDALVRVIDDRVARRRASLAQLRKAVGLTQAQLAATLGIDQAEVSKIERRLNHKLATLERFIQATGGVLRVSAVYGDIEVELGLGELLAEVEAPNEDEPEEPTPTAIRAPKATSATRRTTGVKKASTTSAPKQGQESAVTREGSSSRSTTKARLASEKTTSARARSTQPPEVPRKRAARQPTEKESQSSSTSKPTRSQPQRQKARPEPAAKPI